MTRPPGKLNQVKSQKAWLVPTAHCWGVLDRSGEGEPVVVEECNARYDVAGSATASITQWAKHHAAKFPGHEVEVETRTVAVYYIP